MKRWADAVRLLEDDNLVWSEEFEAIRKPLARVIDEFDSPEIDAIIDALVPYAEVPERVLIVDSTLSEADAEALRQFVIVDKIAQSSITTRRALRKLFRNL